METYKLLVVGNREGTSPVRRSSWFMGEIMPRGTRSRPFLALLVWTAQGSVDPVAVDGARPRRQPATADRALAGAGGVAGRWALSGQPSSSAPGPAGRWPFEVTAANG